MQLFCKKCNILISNSLQELLDKNLLNETDKEDFIPKGYYIISDGGYFTNTEGKLIINKSDLLNCEDYPEESRLNGCCGLDGLDGSNKVCTNGHEIGTEISDCWIANAFIIENGTVKSQKSDVQ